MFPSRNFVGFMAGWFLILALAFGMEAAHAETCSTTRPSAITSIYPTLAPNMVRYYYVGTYSTSTRSSSLGGACGLRRQLVGANWSQDTYYAGGGINECLTGTNNYTNNTCGNFSAGRIYHQDVPTSEVCPALNGSEQPVFMTSESGGPVASYCHESCVFNLSKPTDAERNCTVINGRKACTAVGSGVAWTAPAEGGPGTSAGFYTRTATYCANAESAPATTQPEVAEVCRVVNGATVCQGGMIPGNCIKVDGQQSCWTDAGEVCATPECAAIAQAVKLSDGSAVALSSEPTPKAPNTGTPGVKAPADQVIKAPIGTGFTGGTVSIYRWNPSTVATSNTADGSVGGTSGGTSSSSGGTSSSSGGSSSGGETECDPATEECPGTGACDPATEECGPDRGSGAVRGPGGTARTFGESFGTVKTAWSTSPAATKLAGLTIPSGGSCPSPTISMPYLNTSIVMDVHCTLAAGIRDELRAIFLALWAIVAIGIFLRP